MTVLVTGAAGYVGSMIVNQIERLAPCRVIGVDWVPRPAYLPQDFLCYNECVQDMDTMLDIMRYNKVRKIIHCAASVSVPESVADPLLYYDNNVAGSISLLRAAVIAGVETFVFSSTAAVYGNVELRGRRPVKEDDPTRPCSPYGHSKLMVEQAMRDMAPVTPMRLVTLRYFNVAGADPLGMTGQPPGAPHLITRAIAAAIGGPQLTIYGDGLDVRDYVHVADLARAHIQALDWHGDYLTLNVGSGVGYSVLDVTKAVVEATGNRFTSVMAPAREGDPHYVVADTSRIKNIFGWNPQYDLNSIVEHALKWQRSRSAPTTGQS